MNSYCYCHVLHFVFLIEIRIIPCALSTYYNYIGHSIISFMIFLYPGAPFCILSFITFLICEHITRNFPPLTYSNPNIIADWLFIEFNFIYVLKVRWFHTVFNKLSVLLNHCGYIQSLLISHNVPTHPIAVDSNIMNDHWKKIIQSIYSFAWIFISLAYLKISSNNCSGHTAPPTSMPCMNDCACMVCVNL